MSGPLDVIWEHIWKRMDDDAVDGFLLATDVEDRVALTLAAACECGHGIERHRSDTPGGWEWCDSGMCGCEGYRRS